MSLIRHYSWSAVAAVLMSGSRIIVLAILARRLSATALGQFTYILWMIEIATLACSFGATAAISRYAAEWSWNSPLVAGFLRPWYAWALASSAAAAIAAALGVWVSGTAIDVRAHGLLLFWGAAHGAWAMQTAALVGFRRFDLISLASVVFAMTILTGLWLLPSTGDSFATLFFLMTLASLGACAVGVVTVARQAAGPTATLGPTDWRSIRAYAVNMWITGIVSNLAWSRGEYPMVRAMLGDERLATYAVAMSLFSGAMQGVMLGTSGAVPYLTERWGQGLHEGAAATAKQIVDAHLLVCGVAALALTCLGGDLLHIIVGGRYPEAARIVAILSVGLLWCSLTMPSHLLQLATNGRYHRNLAVAGVILLMGLALVLVPRFALLGSALARATTMVALAFVTARLVAAKLGSMVLSIQNLVRATLTVVVAVGVVTMSTEPGMLVRLAIFAVGACVLMLTIRTDQGDAVALSVVHKFGRFSASRAEASGS